MGVDSLKTTNILIYKSHSQNIKSLYKVIQLNQEYDGVSPVQIAVDGHSLVDFVYVAINNISILVRVPINQAIVVTPGKYFPLSGYTSKYENKISARNHF